MSTSTHAEASTPQKKMQECRRCKEAGFPNQLIGFAKVGEDPATGKINWKLIDEDGEDHRHRSNNYSNDYSQQHQQQQNQRPVFKTRRVADIATVTDLQEARNLLSLGWEYKTSYPATLANIPHYVLVKREQYN
jgi:hypothetical protein